MKRHVLLIDSDPNQQLLFKTALKRTGSNFTCAFAADTAEALLSMKENRPDFVFVEYYLQGLNGLHLLSYMMSKRKLRQVKVYMYTTEISEEISKMAQMLGAAGCILKNAKPCWLSHQLKAILAGDLLKNFVVLQDYTPQIIQAPVTEDNSQDDWQGAGEKKDLPRQRPPGDAYDHYLPICE